VILISLILLGVTIYYQFLKWEVLTSMKQINSIIIIIIIINGLIWFWKKKGEKQELTTWSYWLIDLSPRNIRSLATNALKILIAIRSPARYTILRTQCFRNQFRQKKKVLSSERWLSRIQHSLEYLVLKPRPSPKRFSILVICIQ
jgi:hypothetical protein